MDVRAANEPKLLFPGLAGFYASVSDLWYPMIRITVGACLFVHGWGKLHTGIGGITASMAKLGLVPSAGFAAAAMFLETVGAACVVLGLFTRFFAAAIAIDDGDYLFLFHDAARLQSHGADADLGHIVLRHRITWRRAVFA